MPFLNSSPLPSLSKHFKSQPKTGLDWKYNGSVSACAQNIKLAWEADRLDGASECCSFSVNQDVGVKRWSHHGKCWVRLQRATVSCSLSLTLSPLPSPTLPLPRSYTSFLQVVAQFDGDGLHLGVLCQRILAAEKQERKGET